jgi:uncharacterized RDD family membrane protein YckC/DNA-directed RNA polymerase subunit RPC12/RpoP
MLAIYLFSGGEANHNSQFRSDDMTTKCPECGSTGKLDDEFADRQIRCPRCGSSFVAAAVQQVKWYYAAGDTQIGPIHQDQFDGLVADGTVTPETLVWSKGMTGWQPLAGAQPERAKKWYYADGDRKIGPISQEEFDRLIADGVIAPSSLVWSSGADGWQPLSTVRHGPVPAACAECHSLVAPESLMDHQGRRLCETCRLALLRPRATAPVSAVGPRLKYGGLGSRFLAKIIDLVFMLALAGMVEGLSRKLFPAAFNTSAITPVMVATMTINVLVGVYYVTWFVGKFGATPGKMVCNLKITDPAGHKIGYARAFGRYCGEYIVTSGAMALLILLLYWLVKTLFPFNPVGNNVYWAIIATLALVYGPALFDRQRRTLYDRLCNTRVLAA